MPKLDFSNADKALRIPSVSKEFYDYGEKRSDFRHHLKWMPGLGGMAAIITTEMEEKHNQQGISQTLRQKLMDDNLYENQKAKVKEYLDFVNNPDNQILPSQKELAEKCADNYYKRIEPVKNLNQLAQIATAPRATNRIANEKYDEKESLDRDISAFNADNKSPINVNFSSRKEFEEYNQRLTGNQNKTEMGNIAKNFTDEQMGSEKANENRTPYSSNILKTIDEMKGEYEKTKDAYLTGTISKEAYEKKKNNYVAKSSETRDFLEKNQNNWETYAGNNIDLKGIPREGLKKLDSLDSMIKSDSDLSPKPKGNNPEEGFRKSADGKPESLPEQLAAMEKRLARLDSSVAELKPDIKKIVTFVDKQAAIGLSL